MNNIDFLQSSMQDCGFLLSTNQITAFTKHMDLLCHHNKLFNLTTITDQQDIVLKHFVDSCMGAQVLKNSRTVVDIGTGAGFPGIPLAIMQPHSHFVLIDSSKKKTTFLELVKQELSLKNTEVINGRSEEIGHINTFRENFETAVSRAVAPLHKLVELCLPLVAPGGTFVAYKGNPENAQTETTQAQKAISLMGGQTTDIIHYTIPTTNIVHSLVVIKKITQTKKDYPRKPNKIKNSPITV